MYRYYLSKGHAIEELLNLSAVERSFMLACMELDKEDMNRLYGGINGK